MFIYLIRMLFFAFVVLTVIYFVLRWFMASRRREALENEFGTEVQKGERDAYVEKGMQEYRQSFWRKALVVVYIVPLTLYVLILYLNNYY
ncbi:hypothetical protein ACFE33_13575 [Falsihalocynthiibacter sp. SS001]|uniref:hypothetical protein n=1 Tax=Falsihalocynthiibacter sp. SS001 TaxID=3349698 RepID=UPI0036D38C29